MAVTLYRESQYFTTTLSVTGGINDSITTGIVLQSITGIADTTKPGIALFSYADPLDAATAEWITFTSINSTTKTLVGVTRGQEGFSAKTHTNGVVVAFPHSKSHINEIAKALSGEDSGVTLASPVLSGTITGTYTLGGTPTITSPSLKGLWDGWINPDETWTYASASTITVPSGAAARYGKGDKIKLTQTTVKYFYIVGVADTVLTVTGGSDYTVANAAITENYYSHAESPIGFPTAFNFTVPSFDTGTVDNGTGGQQPSVNKKIFFIQGNRLTFTMQLNLANAIKNNTGSFITHGLPATFPAVSPTYHDLYDTYGYGFFAAAIAKGAIVRTDNSRTEFRWATADGSTIADNAGITGSAATISYWF